MWTSLQGGISLLTTPSNSRMNASLNCVDFPMIYLGVGTHRYSFQSITQFFHCLFICSNCLKFSHWYSLRCVPVSFSYIPVFFQVLHFFPGATRYSKLILNFLCPNPDSTIFPMKHCFLLLGKPRRGNQCTQCYGGPFSTHSLDETTHVQISTFISISIVCIYVCIYIYTLIYIS